MRVCLTSPWVPAEWIKAHGHEPRGIWGLLAPPGLQSNSSPQNSEAQPCLACRATPAAGSCAYAEAVLNFAEREHDLAFVFSTHCDQFRRSFDALTREDSGRMFLFNLPATVGTPAARALFQDEILRLGRWLVRLGGHPGERTLPDLVRQYQNARRELAVAAGSCAARQYAEAILEFHHSGRVNLPASSAVLPGTRSSPRARLALIGGPLLPRDWFVLDVIEQAGGAVVLNASENGERSLGADAGQPVETGTAQTLEHLTGRWLNRMADVYQRPNDQLLTWLKQRATGRRVQGAILWTYFGCDLWRAEFQTLREALAVPVLMLEADETGSGSARMRTRLQAFVEHLLAT